MRLPDAFTLTGIGIGFVLVCVQAFFLAPGEGDVVLDTTHQLRMSSPGASQAQGNVFMTGTEAMVLGRVAAIAGAALLLLAVRWLYKAVRKRDGMGLGDVKLLAMIAAFLGFGEAMLALFAGVLAASVYGIGADGAGKSGRCRRSCRWGVFLRREGCLRRCSGRGLWIGMWGCCVRREGWHSADLQPASGDLGALPRARIWRAFSAFDNPELGSR